MSAGTTVVFACNWGGLSCVEAAAQKGLTYPATVRVLRVGCLARVQPGLLLKAFELGAQNVLLAGCASGECRCENGEKLVDQTLDRTRGVLQMLDISPDRLKVARLRAGDGESLVKAINDFVAVSQRS